MRRTAIALLCVVTLSTIARDRDRDIIRFFRAIFRHFISAPTSDDLGPPKPCTTTTGC